jgi:hypothetical protein
MNARIEIKRLRPHPRFDARIALAAAQLRLAEAVDWLVARWLERCAANLEAAQRLARTDQKPARDYGMGGNLAVSSPRWTETS